MTKSFFPSVGLIGCGQMGANHLNTLTTMNECKISGVLEPDETRQAQIPAEALRFNNVEELYKHANCAIIAVPASQHYTIAKGCLENGLHVLIEKPLALQLEDAEELIRTAKSKNLICQVGHIERFNGAAMELSKIVQRPQHISAVRSAATRRNLDVGVIFDLMIHDIDMLRQIVVNSSPKAPWRVLSAWSLRQNGMTEDIASAHLTNGSTSAFLHASRVTGAKMRSLTISEPDSWLELDYSSQSVTIHRSPEERFDRQPEQIRYRQSHVVEHVYIHRREHALLLELRHFFACCTGKDTPLVSAEEELVTLRMALDILEMTGASGDPS